MGTLPLEGIRVADFSQALSGPFCTMLLADYGADVVKVERAGSGDDSRRWGPPWVGDTAAYYLSVNRNKRSLALDLKSEDDREIAQRLARHADVVVENWRPGTAERLGLGVDAVRATNPNVVYCSISGFGQESQRPGYDQVVQGTSGWMSITGTADGEPTKSGLPIADISSGMFATQAVLAALLRRAQTGEGAHIDLAMQDSLVSMLTYQAGAFFATGESPSRRGNQHASLAPYGTFATSDGSANISVGNERQWTGLCEAIGAPELLTDPRFVDNGKRVANSVELKTALEGALRNVTTDELLAAADKAGVPAGAIAPIGQVLTDPALLARQMVLTAEHPRLGELKSPNSPWHIDGEVATARIAPPDLGAHNDEVIAELRGLSSEG
ncbi:CaiB/BaiF CoA transferase family protein [Gordonia humi]|uniref:Crotonobetainyl-CoA:carnitine CoA-transferase CaiB-like acyl-CoA transferase n=1 Tax=Gordonia humi TaxID=686429 RepID=A0A840F5Y8_9ACTN|nr:CoA transferase [Gordonia humi]MBB4137963.1 crotonobetainyl-CoA:carnitine CoA-transferase CaiB-like acyl-CoA transferase [Gordonia humi]